MSIVGGLPTNPATKARRWPLSTKGRDLPRDLRLRFKVRIELVARALSQADRHMFWLTQELEKAARRMRPAEKKRALKWLTIMQESWVMNLAAAFSRDALREGRRVLSEKPARSKTADAEAWLRRQLAGLGKEE